MFVLQDVSGDNWRRADMLNHWLKYGGVMILGYSLYRNLSQCLRVRSKNQKKIFKEALVDPGKTAKKISLLLTLYCPLKGAVKHH